MKPEQIVGQVTLLRKSCKSSARDLEKTAEALRKKRQQLPSDADHEERNQLDSSIQDVYALKSAIEDIFSYLLNSTGQLLANKNCAFLLGSWGTGKTHFLCDTAQRQMASGKPALLVLASTLAPLGDPLEAIAKGTKLALTGDTLLVSLDKLGRKNNCRALLLVDAINEGDREVWRKQLAHLARKVYQFPNVGLVLSCRRPFQEIIVTPSSEKWIVQLEHRGFEEQEFDAQQAFFSYYEIPAPQMPLITPEFSRPLFLKLFCKAVSELSSRNQKRKLREVASGQKGMTYVLEYFTKKVGKSIERDFKLPSLSCWRLLKGSRDKTGFAGAMADEPRNWVTCNNALSIIQDNLDLAKDSAEALLHRLLSEGLLADDLRWQDGDRIEVIQFPYERFGDQLIARHMLDRYLNKSNETSVRRSFYANRKLGQVFVLDRWGQDFSSPGIAAAIMLEFPERMRKTGLPRELIHYLPKTRRIVGPIKDAFLEGLYWRGPDSFTDETNWITTFLLENTNEWIKNETMEVLIGLATRPKHPYSARWLQEYLSRLSMAKRDLIWSEYLRSADEHTTVYRLLAWIERNPSARDTNESISNEMRLLSLLLTTTKRPLRDRVTRALVFLGLKNPFSLFNETLEMLGFDDLYIQERMLAAAYGSAMRLWVDPDGAKMREHLLPFARQLIHEMFLPGAPHATKHTLTRGYALGIIELTQKTSPRGIATQYRRYLRPGFQQIGSPFRTSNRISEKDLEDVKKAFHMDFENYTLGGLIPGRANYDYDHTEYKKVRLQVLQRMKDLGYSSALFGEIDKQISERQWRGRAADGEKTDRYGKKYSWIAYFEMYGVREDLSVLPDYHTNERSADCDIDPSFPESPLECSLTLPEPFKHAPRRLEMWLRSGPVPSYHHFLEREYIGGNRGGPWVLLDGFILQKGTYNREVFTFISGEFIKPSDLQLLTEQVEQSEYLGNYQVPRARESYYIFAGEIPWSHYYLLTGRQARKKAKRYLDKAFDLSRGKDIAVPVEVPVHRWVWESYHSSLNQVSGITYLAPALCQAFDLVNHNGSFDLYDSNGRPATLYREFAAGENFDRSHLLYMRADLLKKYLATTDQSLVWILWGERTLHWKEFGRTMPPKIQAALSEHENTFGKLVQWPVSGNDS